jgi:hypothetical protein
MSKRELAAVAGSSRRSSRADNAATWTPQIELYLKKLQNKALVYKMLHGRTAAHLSRKGKVMKIINIISTATAGTTLLGNIDASNKVVTIVTALVLYLTSILIGISEFMDWSAEADNHKTAEADFNDLISIIERQLVLEPPYRQHAREFMLWVDHDFKMKLDKSPLITQRMVKKMEKQFGSKLNPELIDAGHINDAAADATASESAAVASQSAEEAEEESKPKAKRKKRTKKQKTQSTEIFQDIEANARISDWDDIRMMYELDRYQQ